MARAHKFWFFYVLLEMFWILGSTPAAAQWTSTSPLLRLPAWEQNRGIRAGSFKFWPKLGLNFGWDSNLFRQSGDEGTTGAAAIRIRPGISIENPRFNLLHFRFDAIGDARFYIGTDESQSAKAAEKQRNFGAEIGFGLTILPHSVFSVRIFDNFRRILEARGYPTDKDFNRNANRAGLSLSLHPGGGALDFQAGYAFGLDHFDEWELGNNRHHEVNFSMSWRFFPKTALIAEARWFYLTYEHANYGGDGGQPGTVPNINMGSKPVLAMVGISGTITPSLNLLLKLGYGGFFPENGEDLHTGIGLFRLAYQVAAKMVLQIGFERSFHDSFYATYYVDDNPFAAFQWRPLPWLEMRARGGYHHLSYSPFDFRTPGRDGIPGSGDDRLPNMVDRVDHGFDTRFEIEFDAARYVGVTIGYRLEGVSTDFVIQSAAQEVLDRLDYLRHIIFAEAELRY